MMHIGIIDLWNETGKYGVIQSGTVEGDVFWHIKNIELQELKDGEQVEFEFEQTMKGLEATRVRRNTEAAPVNNTNTDTQIYKAGSDDKISENDTYTGTTSGSNELPISNCPKCKSSVNSDDNFCASCGETLKWTV